MHYTPTTTHPTTKKHKSYLWKQWQNGTRCRDGMKVLWCHSHLVWLVFEASIPTCTCFPSENFLWLVNLLPSLPVSIAMFADFLLSLWLTYHQWNAWNQLNVTRPSPLMLNSTVSVVSSLHIVWFWHISCVHVSRFSQAKLQNFLSSHQVMSNGYYKHRGRQTNPCLHSYSWLRYYKVHMDIQCSSNN